MKLLNGLGCIFSALFGGIFALIGAGVALLSMRALPPQFSQNVEGFPPFMGELFGGVFFLVGVKIFSSGIIQLNGIETPFIRISQQFIDALVMFPFGALFFWAGLQDAENTPLLVRLPFLLIGAGIAAWGLWALSGALRSVFRRGGSEDDV